MGSAPLITVPIPTVTGREEFLERAIRSYQDNTENVEVLVYHDLPTCGEGWMRGIAEGSGDYFFMGADDVDAEPGWWQETARFCDLGFLPAARVLNSDGTLQSCGDWAVEMPTGSVPIFTRTPFFSRAQWATLEPLVGPVLADLHYFSDNIFTWAGRKLGIETAVCRSFLLTHHLAAAGRGAGMTAGQRMGRDHAVFQQYTGGASGVTDFIS